MSDSEDGSDVEVQQDLIQVLSSYGDSLLDQTTVSKPNEKKSGARRQQAISNGVSTKSDVNKYRRLTFAPGKTRIAGDVMNKVKEALKGGVKPRPDKGGRSAPEVVDPEAAVTCVSEDQSSSEEDSVSEHESDMSCDDEKGEGNGAPRRLQRMKEELGLLDTNFLALNKCKQNNAGEDVGGCGADLRPIQQQRPPPELVVFDDGRKTKKKKRDIPVKTHRDPTRLQSTEDGDDFDLKQARHDVRRFGISGLEGASREDANMAMMVRLGAKQPKKDYVNYRQLQEKRKLEKEETKSRREWDRSMGYKVTNSAKRYNANRSGNKKDRNDVGIVDGQIGMYRGGVQKLTQLDIEAVKKSNKKRKRTR